MPRGELDLTNAGLKSAFTQYAELVSKDKVAPLFPASGTQSAAVANGRFTAGNVAMYVDGPWQLINVKKKANFTVGLAPVPVREAGSISISAGSGFGIATTSKNKDAAWKAMQVMTGPDAEQYLASKQAALSRPMPCVPEILVRDRGAGCGGSAGGADGGAEDGQSQV